MKRLAWLLLLPFSAFAASTNVTYCTTQAVVPQCFTVTIAVPDPLCPAPAPCPVCPGPLPCPVCPVCPVPPPTVADTLPPSVPSGLVATAVSPTQVNLSWNPSTDNVGVASYQVYLNDVWLADTQTTSFQHTGRVPGTTYTYRVSASDAMPNYSAWSAAVSATTPAVVTSPPPVAGPVQLLFSDLTSGPVGSIVTVWGKGLAQGTISVGGVAAQVLEWRNADGPSANLYLKHGLQQVAFTVPVLPLGVQSIQATIGGATTNTLPFTVRAGKIYHVKTSGLDSNVGSFDSPWRTIPKAVNTISNGDIIYVGDGVSATAMHEFRGCVNLSRDGTAALPRALIAYPGATVNVGGAGATCQQPFSNWNSVQSASGGQSTYWVVSKMRALGIGGDEAGIGFNQGYRVVGNYIRIPKPNDNCQSAALSGTGSDVALLGNQVTNTAIDNPNTISKLCHTIYLSGKRSSSQYGDTCGGVRCPTESNREIGWNLLNDNFNNRGINIYSEQDRAAFLEGHRVHDNHIINQRGVGILIGYYVTGENWFYNNVLINTGLGPDWAGGNTSGHNAMQINGGHESGRPTTLHIKNNTIYGGGFPGSTMLNWFKFQPGITGVTLDFADNIIVSPTLPYWSADSTLDGSPVNVWWPNAKPAWNSGGIVADPMFVDPANGDFRLKPGSPATGKGAL